MSRADETNIEVPRLSLLYAWGTNYLTKNTNTWLVLGPKLVDMVGTLEIVGAVFNLANNNTRKKSIRKDKWKIKKSR